LRATFVSTKKIQNHLTPVFPRVNRILSDHTCVNLSQTAGTTTTVPFLRNTLNHCHSDRLRRSSATEEEWTDPYTANGTHADERHSHENALSFRTNWPRVNANGNPTLNLRGSA